MQCELIKGNGIPGTAQVIGDRKVNAVGDIGEPVAKLLEHRDPGIVQVVIGPPVTAGGLRQPHPFLTQTLETRLTLAVIGALDTVELAHGAAPCMSSSNHSRASCPLMKTPSP